LSSSEELVVWLLIFIVLAIILSAKATGKFFLHGFLIAIVNSVWVTGSHVALFDAYKSTHQSMFNDPSKLPIPDNPQLGMVLFGPLIGIASGLVLGLFSVIAARIRGRKSQS
jgi:hypothetical protein